MKRFGQNRKMSDSIARHNAQIRIEREALVENMCLEFPNLDAIKLLDFATTKGNWPLKDMRDVLRKASNFINDNSK